MASPLGGIQRSPREALPDQAELPCAMHGLPTRNLPSPFFLPFSLRARYVFVCSSYLSLVVVFPLTLCAGREHPPPPGEEPQGH